MKRFRRIAFVAAPAAAVAVMAGAAGLAQSAAASTGYADTSVQGSNFVFEHYVTGPAKVDATPIVPGTVDVTGLKAFPAPSSGGGVVYKITSNPDVDGVTLSVTDTDLTFSTTGVISADGSLNHAAGTSVATIVKLSATDKFGDVATITLPAVVRDNSVTYDTAHADELATDEVYDLGVTDDNPTGSVVFTGKNTGDAALTFSEANLPAGLASGNPLLPGTAVPGTYKDQTVTASDATGASATGTFLLKVNGGAAPAAAVPVLSHGSATYVSPNRENVEFATSLTTWVEFQIAGPGPIGGKVGWVLAKSGSLNQAVYSGLEANHTYAVYYKPVTGKGSTTQIVGTKSGQHVTFISNTK